MPEERSPNKPDRFRNTKSSPKEPPVLRQPIPKVITIDKSSNAPVLHSEVLREKLATDRFTQQSELDQKLRQVVQYGRYTPRHPTGNPHSRYAMPQPVPIEDAELSLDPVAKRKANVRRVVEFLIFLIVAYAILWAVRSTIFDSYDVPSGSMENTVMTSDKLFVQRIEHLFGYNPKGAIVVFDDPVVENRLLLKRIVAVAGETVDFRNGQLLIDGVPQIEPYTEGKESLPARDAPLLQNIPQAECEENDEYCTDGMYMGGMGLYYPYKIPAGYVWCMGDNRPYSQDSRYFGPVKVDTIIGRAWLAYTGFDNFRWLG